MTISVVRLIADKGSRRGATPPPYPTGWFKMIDSFDLPKKYAVAFVSFSPFVASHLCRVGWCLLALALLSCRGVKHVNILGTNLVVYRGKSGKAFALDAYCPHLGANLGIGGVVKDDCIMCPFHGYVIPTRTVSLRVSHRIGIL